MVKHFCRNRNKILVFIIHLGIGFAGCNIKPKTGLYLCYFPELRIELEKDGSAIISPKNNNANYCQSFGTWRSLGDSIELNLNFDSDCDWISQYEGSWRIERCKTFDDELTWCLKKGNIKLVHE